MSKKKNIKVADRIIATIDKTKEVTIKANDFALNTTEEIVNESLTIAEQWQKVATRAIKAGFKLAANQQELVFDALESFKGQYAYGKKRFSKLFA